MYDTIVIDVETWNSRSFAFGVVWFGFNEFEVFDDADKMKDFILSLADKTRKSKNIKILGHNIQYDLSWIFGNPEIFFSPKFVKENKKKRYWKNILTRNGKFYFAKYYNLRFEDTLNLFPMSLEKAGEVVGYEKLKTPEKFIKDNQPKVYTNEDIKYCVRDCEVTFLIYQKMKEFVEMYGGQLKLTLASSSLSIIQNTVKEIPEWIKKLNRDHKLQFFDEHFRKSYYGGRTEVIRSEIRNANYYDINSLYPYVLQNDKFNYPNPLTYRKYEGNIENVLPYYEGTARIKFECPYMDIPLLPIRDKKLGKLVYGYGIVEGNYNFPEIRKALELGYQIIDYSDVIIAERVKSPLKDYISTLYSERLKKKEEGSPEEKIIKLFLNSAYGKFAQRNGGSKFVALHDAEDHDFGNITKIDGVDYLKIESPLERGYCDIVSIASYTTTYARLTLYGYLEMCQDVTYYDTDSIITITELPTSTELGKMKLEGKIKYGSFKGRKDYYIEMNDDTKMIKRKGISVKKILSINGNKVTSEEINDYLLDIHNSDILEFSKITKSRESIIQNLESGRTKIQKKERKYSNDTGRLFTGIESRPMEVEI